jgi:hypothetical protein
MTTADTRVISTLKVLEVDIVDDPENDVRGKD